MQTMADPTVFSERLESLDILRGIAVLMILFVNMPAFVAPFLFDPVPLMNGIPDRSIRLFFDLFIENRFYPIFSFLFGAGFYIFMARLSARGLFAGLYYVRRVAILFVFGVLHMILFWPGDILHTYAWLGLLLLLFVGRSPKTMFVWATVLLVLGVLQYGLSAVGLSFMWVSAVSAVQMFDDANGQAIPGRFQEVLNAAIDTNDAMLPDPSRLSEALNVYTHGSWGEWVGFHLTQEIPVIFQQEIYALFGVFPFMLFGLYAAKRGVLNQPADHRVGLMRLLVVSSIVALPLEFVIVYLSTVDSPESLARLLGLSIQLWAVLAGWTMSFLYLALYFLWGVRDTWQRRLHFLAPVGRMALSNYFLQTVLMTLIVRLFALYGKTPLWLGLVFVLLILPINIVVSHVWLRTFCYGPLEYLWRIGTYGRMFPLKCKESSRTARS